MSNSHLHKHYSAEWSGWVGPGIYMSCKVLELNLMDDCLSRFSLIDCESFRWSIVTKYHHNGTVDNSWIMLWRKERLGARKTVAFKREVYQRHYFFLRISHQKSAENSMRCCYIQWKLFRSPWLLVVHVYIYIYIYI